MTKATVRNKLWMKKNQADARKIMMASSNIWSEQGWTHGGMVKQSIFKKEMIKKLGKKKFDPVVSEILEDANYHTANSLLQKTGLVKYRGDRLIQYMKLGGKTWEL